MNKQEFWAIVDNYKNEDSDIKYEKMAKRLARDYTLEDIGKFHRMSLFDIAHTLQEDGGLYRIASSNLSNLTDDGFTDFIGWIIGQGSSVYNEVVDDASNVLKYMEEKGDCRDENMMYVGYMAYEMVTGKCPSEFVTDIVTDIVVCSD